VDPALPPTTKRRIIVPRRLFPKNGVEFFVRALPLILEEVEVEAILVGDGPERPRLEALARELGVARQISFVGRKPHREMPGLLCSGVLVVVPSLMEATSVAALESMACGVPVAASAVGGLPEIVDESVGGLFRPGSPEDLARVVKALLRDPALARRGVLARERVVKDWSNLRLAERHLEIYEALLRGRG
jgi:glycosyltransferase involved in cell wall biosynthesis